MFTIKTDWLLLFNSLELNIIAITDDDDNDEYNSSNHIM
jgi:hypothetical protein